MKKTIAVLLSVIMLFISICGCSPTPPVNHQTDTQKPAEDNETESALHEAPVEDFEYKLNHLENAIIITKYSGNDEHVVIPSEIDGLPVITIGSCDILEGNYYINIGAFQNSNIKSVVIPDSVTFIQRAFSDCKYLSEVTFGKNSNLDTIESAFQNCISLEALDLSTTKLTEISNDTFNGCKNLRSINISDSVTSIGERAFYECESLKEIVLPKNLEDIGRNAFGYCTLLKTITIPAKLDINEGLTQSVFHDVPSLEKVIFEEGRDEIKGYAFISITSDAEIIVPASVKKLSLWSFFFLSPANAKIVFLGDCPEFLNEKLHEFYAVPTIYYDPNTEGWDNCILEEAGYTLLPID